MEKTVMFQLASQVRKFQNMRDTSKSQKDESLMSSLPLKFLNERTFMKLGKMINKMISNSKKWRSKRMKHLNNWQPFRTALSLSLKKLSSRRKRKQIKKGMKYRKENRVMMKGRGKKKKMKMIRKKDLVRYCHLSLQKMLSTLSRTRTWLKARSNTMICGLWGARNQLSFSSREQRKKESYILISKSYMMKVNLILLILRGRFKQLEINISWLLLPLRDSLLKKSIQKFTRMFRMVSRMFKEDQS